MHVFHLSISVALRHSRQDAVGPTWKASRSSGMGIGEFLGNTAIDSRFGKGFQYPRPSYRVVEYDKDSRECYS